MRYHDDTDMGGTDTVDLLNGDSVQGPEKTQPPEPVVEDGSGDSADSELEDEVKDPNKILPSERRRALDYRFKDLLSRRAEAVTAEDIKAVIKATDDTQLSMTNLIAKQDYTSIIHDPREYQLELFEKAKEKNIIAVLETGSGKTLIAVLLLKHVIEQELTDRSLGRSHRISFFLVDSVTLVYQQAAVLQNNIAQKMDKFCGAMQTDLWNKETWEGHFKRNMLIVCTAEVLHQCLLHSFIRMDQINLLIFDEAHHAKKEHPYARIIKDFYMREPKKPKIFGMTASPVDAKVDVVNAAKTLETMLDSQIATASNLSLLRQSVARPTEETWEYDGVESPFKTPLHILLHQQFGDIKVLEKIFRFSYEASSALGSWCSDWVWSYCLSEETLPKLEARSRRPLMRNLPSEPSRDTEAERIRAAGALISNHDFGDPVAHPELLSHKVRVLQSELLRRFKENPDTRCIVFTAQRHTARILRDLFKSVAPQYIRPNLLVGVRSGGDRCGSDISFREQFLNVIAFRKGEINCLFATSVAEEGLDIQDCNLIVRFDLYSTLIQYIQSRGRARHTDSTFAHMVERNNLIHETAVEEVRRAEEVMARFCRSLPEDRLLKGVGDVDGIVSKERQRKSYTIQSTGAKLTYPSSLAVLAHYASTLQYEKELSAQVSYIVHPKDGAFICEAILPEKSPVRGCTGKSASQKILAKQSAAFETCLVLRKNGLLDDYFISTYHKRLPAMRNAKLAITSKKSNQYSMISKPAAWEESRGISPATLFATILYLSNDQGLRRHYHPLVLLTRVPMPNFPSFPLYLENNTECDGSSLMIEKGLRVSHDELDLLTKFTFRVFQDVFHKIYEEDSSLVSYWIAPAKLDDRAELQKSNPSELIDWQMLQYVRNTEELLWSPGMPDSFLANRFLVDKWDGRYRYLSLEVDPTRRPSDPIPENMPRRRHMDNIMNYGLSLFKNSHARFLAKCNWDQPVLRAELFQLRRNFLDRDENKKGPAVEYYICPEALKISSIPAPVATFTFVFPAMISRIESYLVALEACEKLQLQIPPEIALEALTKDSDNMEEHRLEQIHIHGGMGKNYERLEFLGDCFLKMATSISLFAMNPDNDEYDFHVKRMLLICNQNLFNNAITLDIFKFIRSRSFSRRAWYPEGLNLLKGKAQKEGPEGPMHALADKTIADVCEALIGASLLAGGSAHKFDMATKAVTIFVNSDDHRVENWAGYSELYSLPGYQTAIASAPEVDVANQIEAKLGYRFRYPRLLRSAFMHPSYPSQWANVPCYQRLEFLGDSLLDMVCVNYLFTRYPDKDPQWLTEHKMAMVSNKFLGSVAVSLKLHVHLIHISNTLQGQITSYAEELEAMKIQMGGNLEAWTYTNEPPKCLPDIVEAYIGAIFVDSDFNFEVVEDFFRRLIQHYFEDMTVYDTFANKHPITFLHTRLAVDFGCTFYALKADEIPCFDDSTTRALAAVVVHDDIVAEGLASSPRYAKLKASQNALKELEDMSAAEFRALYKCDCHEKQKEQEEEFEAAEGQT
ncbi:Dicer-like protein 1 [Arthroderma sp. PD_2]|nr:Dicer-like protein 1 [Arthroderma sp. PD_2]